MKKKKSVKEKSVNVTEKVDSNESNNCAMLTFHLPQDPSTLVCMSDYKHEAYSANQCNGLILNCGASSHFTPQQPKLLNYKKINLEPI